MIRLLLHALGDVLWSRCHSVPNERPRVMQHGFTILFRQANGKVTSANYLAADAPRVLDIVGMHVDSAYWDRGITYTDLVVCAADLETDWEWHG